MQANRFGNENFTKSEEALDWAESRNSKLLWIDGNQILSRTDFNASFVSPLLLIGESTFESVLILRHFCEAVSNPAHETLVLLQALLFDLFKQFPSVYERKRKSITRDQSCDIDSLWSLLLGCFDEVQADCIFIIIGGIDNLASTNTDDGADHLVYRFKALVNDSKRLVKILLATQIKQAPEPAVESYSSLIRLNNLQYLEPALPFNAVNNSAPLDSWRLIEAQEKRWKSISFTELPILYPIGATIYVGGGTQYQAFVISELSGIESRPFGAFGPLHIRAWSIDHNGSYFCKRYHDFTVSHFSGPRDIADLRYIPAGYLQEEAMRRREMILRGRMYWSQGDDMNYMQMESKKVI